MREIDVFSGEEVTGNADTTGSTRQNSMREGFKRFIVEKMLTSLMDSFPEETREAIKKYS